MRKAVIILVALAMGFSLGAGAQGYAMRYYTGNIYMKMPEAMRAGYVTGVADALMSVAVGGEDPGLFQKSLSGMGSVEGKQLLALVDKYMREHPEVWGYTMASIVYAAVTAHR